MAYLKKYLAYISILGSVCFAFFSGKEQGHAECIDFNILPIVHNFITVIICLTLIVFGVILLKKYNQTTSNIN